MDRHRIWGRNENGTIWAINSTDINIPVFVKLVTEFFGKAPVLQYNPSIYCYDIAKVEAFERKYQHLYLKVKNNG